MRIRVHSVHRIVAVLTFLAFCRPAAACDLVNEELLSWPTSDGVTISVVALTESDVRIEFGTTRDLLDQSTEDVTALPEQLTTIRLDGLEADTKYFYRVVCNQIERPLRKFRTARSLGQRFNFAFGTDSHYYRHWASAECGGVKSGLENFKRTMKNIWKRRPDLMVVGGDWAQTQCNHCARCDVDGKNAGVGNVNSLEQAVLRHRQTRRGHEEIGHSIPLFFVLGNHDGEADFYASDFRCNTPEIVPDVSRAGRFANHPQVPEGFNAGSDSNYYSFTWGDALFVVLDVMRYPSDYPSSASDWTLEQEQLEWLEEVLSASESKWKFVFMEHLVGGVEGKGCYYYGRGGVRATETSEATGEFLGEQAILHTLFKTYGVQLVFYGHDHIFSFAEKKNADGEGDGVYYMCGGRLAKTRRESSKWKRRNWFQKLYDTDGDNKADFLGASNGSSIGYTNVTVDGSDSVKVEVFETHRKRKRNNKRIFSYTIESE